MYLGYRLKIDGTVYPNNRIAKGTYNATDAKRVVEIFVDARKVEHEIVTDDKKATIEFDIIEHDSDDHENLMSPFGNENVSVEFYNDRTGAYRTAQCRIENIRFGHRNTYGNKLQYGKTHIKLVEN